MFLFAALTFAAFSQVPEAFNYQSVVRDASGGIVPNQGVTFRISILQDSESGTVVYSETHSPTTSSLGLANFKIGKGTVVSGTFGPAGWGLNTHFVKIEIDPAGGSSFNHLGTSELLSVPYAFHAETASNVDDDDADPANELQTMSISGTQLTLSNGGGVVSLPSSGGGDNWGTQSVESDATLTGDGTSASPLSVVADGDDWGTQSVASDATLSGNGTAANPLSVEGDLTDDQTLSVSGNDLTISNGNTVALPSGGTSLWLSDDDDIYFNTGKIGVGKIPGADLRKFQVLAGNEQAIAAENNSNYPAIYLRNNGSGPAAEFRNNIKIVDGDQGAGKILTSDANGLASWQTPASGGSLWTQDGNIISYSSGTVEIGTIDVPDESVLLDVRTTNKSTAFYAYNDDALNATIQVYNAGSGPAAYFRNSIKIKDGTEGAGQVLTSDANGLASWQTPASGGSLWTQSGNDLYYNSGNIGIGTTPESLFLLDAYQATTYARLRVRSGANHAYIFVDRKTTSDNSELIFQTNGSNSFYTGLIGDDKYQITTSSTALNGLEVETDGDVNISDELHSAATGAANMVPVAYGTILADGTIKASTGNFTLNKTATGKYEIAISGESYIYYNYITTATLISTGFIRASSTSGKLLIFTSDTSNVADDMIFSFVVYQP